MRFFTKQEDNFLKRNYKKIPAKRMSVMLNRTESTARQRMKLLGIIVPPEIVEKFRKKSQFKKGQEPPNKGKKWSEYMSREGMRNSRKTTFKKGQRTHNEKHDFDITVRNDKTKTQYLFIRVAKGKWVPLLRYNWEKVNGPIPKGMNLIHADGDRMNCRASNGLLLTNAELMQRNTYHRYPKEIATAIQLSGALTRQINKHLKRLRDEK